MSAIAPGDGVLEVATTFGSSQTAVSLLEVGFITGRMPRHTHHAAQGASILNVSLPVAASDIELWWPAGYGTQPLYDVNVTFTPARGTAIAVSRRIGFRLVRSAVIAILPRVH